MSTCGGKVTTFFLRAGTAEQKQVLSLQYSIIIQSRLVGEQQPIANK
jgi:hypothetical protein